MADLPDAYKTYLDYLDKEMSIMGVLCAFSVGVLALVLDRILGAENKTTLTSLWQHEHKYVLTASTLALVSALMFYRQRSLLAWYYGQITLSLIKSNVTGREADTWLKEADSWATWITYRIGWDCLGLAMWTFMAALIDAKLIDAEKHPQALPLGFLWLPIVVCAAVEVPHLVILSLEAYRFKDNPREQAFKDAREKLKAVYGRLFK